MPGFLKKLLSVAFFALALSFGTSPAQAELTNLPTEAGKTWEHDWTNMAFPARIGAFERDRISALEDRQTNIAANYYEDTTGSYLTIYLYRPGTPSVAIWFDRSLFAISQRDDDYGAIDTDDLKIGTFVPAGGEVESGQYAVTDVDGRMRSTALAMHQAGEWLVKVRISSSRLNVGEMETLLLDTLKSLSALDGLATTPAKFMTGCEAPLLTERSRLVDLNTTSAYSLALEASAALTLRYLEGSTEEKIAPVQYCRMGKQSREYATYRPVNSISQYLIALSDSGRHIEVAPSEPLTQLVGPDNGQSVYQIIKVTALESTIYTPAQGLPVGEVLGSSYGQPSIAKVSRVLGDESPQFEITAR